MRLLPLSAYAEVFEPLRGKQVGYVPMPGNPGDALIELATFHLLQELGIHYEVYQAGKPSEAEVFVIAGGGNMGSFYPAPRQIREQVLALGRPVVVLPQTFLGPEPLPYARVFVRERRSLRFYPSAVLAPDLALGLSWTCREQPVRRRGVWLRQDAEGSFAWYPSEGDPARLCRTVEDYLRLAGQHEELITDRLHFAIAGLLCRRRVTLLPGAYFKNLAMWEAWLKDLGCQWADQPEEVGGR